MRMSWNDYASCVCYYFDKGDINGEINTADKISCIHDILLKSFKNTPSDSAIGKWISGDRMPNPSSYYEDYVLDNEGKKRLYYFFKKHLIDFAGVIDDKAIGRFKNSQERVRNYLKNIQNDNIIIDVETETLEIFCLSFANQFLVLMEKEKIDVDDEAIAIDPKSIERELKRRKPHIYTDTESNVRITDCNSVNKEDISNTLEADSSDLNGDQTYIEEQSAPENEESVSTLAIPGEYRKCFFCLNKGTSVSSKMNRSSGNICRRPEYIRGKALNTYVCEDFSPDFGLINLNIARSKLRS